MQPPDKCRSDKVHRYCCSNPNCKKVFSKPKIIKYYVCPTCQTIVDMTLDNFPSTTQEKPVLKKKLVALRKQKEKNQDIKQEPKVITSQHATIETESVSMDKPEAEMVLETMEPARITSQQATSDNGFPSMEKEKPEVKEISEEIEPAQMDEPNIVEVTLNKKSGLMGSDYDVPFKLENSDEQRETVNEETSQSSDFKCQYYFGYLSQRSKDEVIPETCFGCLKSIECMMSEYNKPKETMEEIKKWYSFKL